MRLLANQVIDFQEKKIGYFYSEFLAVGIKLCVCVCGLNCVSFVATGLMTSYDCEIWSLLAENKRRLNLQSQVPENQMAR